MNKKLDYLYIMAALLGLGLSNVLYKKNICKENSGAKGTEKETEVKLNKLIDDMFKPNVEFDIHLEGS